MKNKMPLIFLISIISFLSTFDAFASKEPRKIINLTGEWDSKLVGSAQWSKVFVPHNWDQYYGSRLYSHSNLHANALYKRAIVIREKNPDKRYFLTFEGLGSYGTVIVNCDTLCSHQPIGRVSYTIDVTNSLESGKNDLVVLCEHPEMITDMPWVCGGCSSEHSSCEGTQPLGIFRPVYLEVTDDVRVEPFGIHAWNNYACDTMYVENEVKNYGLNDEKISVLSYLSDLNGKRISKKKYNLISLQSGESKIVKSFFIVSKLQKWSPDNPNLYFANASVYKFGKLVDKSTTRTGIRSISWPCKRVKSTAKDSQRFYINGKPFFINGTCEYEHRLGMSHAFENEEIDARMRQIKSVGFNAFRDAHQPHNKEYQKDCETLGLLWWPQYTSHLWYDTPSFRDNFKKLLIQWVKERRNSPALILWGLENESSLPKDFAAECSNIIRKLDPTCNDMRVITTCNGGTGTDWNVIQNWSGTYGGNMNNYAKELTRRDQLLNGEYGAWRTFGLHQEIDGRDKKRLGYTEEHFCNILHKKLSLAMSVKDSVCGQFQWLFMSHENPGRSQFNEAYHTIDNVGPVNYKGLLTAWGEPTDAYYMYKAACSSYKNEPVVYIVSHTWKDRFVHSGPSSVTIQVYSNCPKVMLLNATDIIQRESINLLKKNKASLITTKSDNGLFTFKDFKITTNSLIAIGLDEKGKRVESIDRVVFDGLPQSKGFASLLKDEGLLKGKKNMEYIYRVNCGGDNYTDMYNQRWVADGTIFSHSWAMDKIFEKDSINPYQASQGVCGQIIKNCKDNKLVQSYRWGREHFYYYFKVMPKERYKVELYFIEPWWGIGLNDKADCSGYRLFDVNINGVDVEKDLDIWSLGGFNKLVKREYSVKSDADGNIKISFPHVKVSQAVISAIAIAAKPLIAPQTKQVASSFIENNQTNNPSFSWVKLRENVQSKSSENRLNSQFASRKATRYTPEIIMDGKFLSSVKCHIAIDVAQVYALRFRYNNSEDDLVCKWRLVTETGNIVSENTILLPGNDKKWSMVSTTTNGFINAGKYILEITPIISTSNLKFEYIDIQ